MPDLYPSCGVAWPSSSLIWGARAGKGAALAVRSPCDGVLLQQMHLLDQDELAALFAPQPSLPHLERDECAAYAARLHAVLSELDKPLLQAMQRETGFLDGDCAEMLQGAFDYVRDFPAYFTATAPTVPAPIAYDLPGQKRHIRLVRQPWGTIAIILPQNAFLLVALTALLNALATGNRIIMRAPQGAARSAALLSVALERAGLGEHISLVMASSRPFVTTLCESSLPCLLHYMGSSQHAPAILAQAFEGGKAALADGAGNCWVWVGADANVEHVCAILSDGALRYNGQTCTSINGALVHPSLYDQVRDGLVERWRALKAGNPLNGRVHVGPLFDEAQATWCREQAQNSGGTILCGGTQDGNLLAPTLVAEPQRDSSLVCEGVFGPVLWLGAGDKDEFIHRWTLNRYPLCAGVLSPGADAETWTGRLSNLARLTLNGDPSVEHIFEPWGAYPASGLNTVGVWHHKYERIVAVDELA